MLFEWYAGDPRYSDPLVLEFAWQALGEIDPSHVWFGLRKYRPHLVAQLVEWVAWR